MSFCGTAYPLVGIMTDLSLKKFLLQCFFHLGIFVIGKVDLTRIHSEHASEVRTVLVFRNEVEMKVLKSVGIGTIVNLVGIEYFLHCACDTCHVRHEGIAVVVAKEIKVVDMVFVGHKATAAVGLLLEYEHTRNTKLRNFNHKAVKCLIVLAIEAFFRIAFHFFCFFICICAHTGCVMSVYVYMADVTLYAGESFLQNYRK